MYNVCLFGPSPDEPHYNYETINSKVRSVLDVLRFQYGNDLRINVDGDPGVGQATIDAAIDMGIKYHLFLTSVPSPLTYADEINEKMKRQYDRASAITIVAKESNPSNVFQRDESLVNASSFLICFWQKNKQGRTFNIIKHALKCNKLVLNGLDEMRLITNMDVRR